MKRITPVFVTLALALAMASCGGNSTLDNDEAPVVLTIDISEYNPDINLCTQTTDLAIDSMDVQSEAKNPAGGTSTAMDVNLKRWVITPYRTDGGTVASPQWIYDQAVYVPAGGTADLSNYRVYPFEYLSEIPLSYLLAENGVDPETGSNHIRQSLELQIFGETVAGKSVATVPISIAFNFYCLGQ